MAVLVEFAIVRRIGFRHDAEQMSALDSERAIVEAVTPAHRRADEDQRPQGFGRLDEGRDRRRDAIEQSVLHDEIVDRVGRQREFRKCA